MEHFAVYESPFGPIRISYAGKQITQIRKMGDVPVYGGTRTESTDRVCRELEEYFSGRRKVFDFPYVLEGTVFQKKVWAQLAAIPYGETRTYGEIAAAIGNPRASRAVGMANNRNPLIIVIPCHRVIGADGSLTGYAGGLAMKEALLRLEATYK
jgi:O-6-methylguanine DNA methyltransferase